MYIGLKNKFNSIQEQWIAANVEAALALDQSYDVKAWLDREGARSMIGVNAQLDA